LSLPNFSRTYFSLSFFYCSKHTVKKTKSYTVII
jgi:hypothetical protein